MYNRRKNKHFASDTFLLLSLPNWSPLTAQPQSSWLLLLCTCWRAEFLAAASKFKALKSVAAHPKYVYIKEMLWSLLNRHLTVSTSPGSLLWKLLNMKERVQMDSHRGNPMVLECFMERSSSCTTVTTLNTASKDRASKSKTTAPARQLFCPDRQCFGSWPDLKEWCSADDGAYHVEMSSCE